jgi:hypothetical protein
MVRERWCGRRGGEGGVVVREAWGPDIAYTHRPDGEVRNPKESVGGWELRPCMKVPRVRVRVRIKVSARVG